MNPGQTRFYDFILERTQPDKQEVMKTLLADGFAKQEEGAFTEKYFVDYTLKLLSYLKPEHVAEVKAITENFGKHQA